MFSFKHLALAVMCSGMLIHSASAEVSNQEIENVIQCKTTHAAYMNLGDDFDNQLKKLGWKNIKVKDQILIEVYRNSKPINVFGQPTNEIAFVNSGLTAVYRNADVKKLAKTFKIPESQELKELMPFFRGEKLVKTEPKTADSMTIHQKLILSDMPGEEPIVLLGCSYEIDENEAENMFNPEYQ